MGAYLLIGVVVYLALCLLLARFMGMAGECDYQASRKPRNSMERLKEIETFAAWHREQMEGELQELCEYCGTHADSETLERDWCVDVVYNGLPLGELFARMSRLKQKEIKTESASDASQ